jgi:predicted dehydrogenase
MSNPINIAMIGTGFMGRAHSQAWASVNRFFDLPKRVQMHIVAGRDLKRTETFCERWGWTAFTTDWKSVFEDEAIDMVDIVTPNHVHGEQAIAALGAGKHVACEKPLAGALEDAHAMCKIARATRSSKRVKTFVWFNYRRCPAVAFAHQLVREGKLGRLFHVRAAYLQDWGEKHTPMSWRYDASLAGSGAHGDLNAHIVDLARFITGDEISEVSGAIEERFVDVRSSSRRPGKKQKSSVDDCVLFLARFKGGAVATFEATRLATGNLNRNAIEINGERGSLKFDFERMNELQWWDATLPEKMQGWSRILCTTPGEHPYMDAFWPPGHLIGYEHCFISQAADIIRVLCGQKPLVPLADFEDAYETQRVLHAAIVSARERRCVDMSEIDSAKT